ncbi:MAG: type II secretion system protein [Verrucomicrobiota bacterium]
MKANHETLSGRGFTLVELMVTIVIIVVLAGLSISMVSRIKTKTNLAASVQRVRDLGPMLHAYSQDEAGRLPVWQANDEYWWEMIANPDDYDPERIFRSPGHREFDPQRVDATISYGWNVSVMGRFTESTENEPVGQRRMAQFRRPNQVLVLADGAKENGFGLIEPNGALPDPERYKGEVAALMLDGTARIMDATTDFAEDSEWFQPRDL